MTGHGYRKQVLLFLTAVLLPCIVLVALTLRMVVQERELARQRAVEERRREARDFGQALLVRLEGIKLLEVAAASEEGSSAGIAPVHSEVVLVCPVAGRSIVLPWEADPAAGNAKRLLGEKRFAARVAQAERMEFARKDARMAAEMYGRILEETSDPVRSAFLRLNLARALGTSGQAGRALDRSREALKTPLGVTDEYGIPMCLYAARSLLRLGRGFVIEWEVLRAGFKERRWLSPAASHFLLDVIREFVGGAVEEEPRREAEAFKAEVEKSLGAIGRASDLKTEFPFLFQETERGLPASTEGPLWRIHGEPPWLVSISPPLSGDRAFLLAVDARQAMDVLVRSDDMAGRLTGKFTTASEADPAALSPGPGFRGLRLRYLNGPESALSDAGGIRPSFYIAALVLILGIASLGAYFLWRDVRREVRMAELRSQFVSGVSHELKTPLTAIRMFAETLRLGRSRDRRSEEEYLDTIVNESQRLTRLLNNVLDFSKMEKGKRPYRMDRLSASEVIQAAARAMDYPLRQQGYHLRVRSEEDLPDLRGDRDALEQAVLNLLHNAMKYSGEARDIDLELKREGSSLLIQVRDRGVGIEAKEQKKIFEKFYRVPSPENERLPGAGLGLALVTSIVKAHGGSLKVESAPGEGSTFTLILPIMEAR